MTMIRLTAPVAMSEFLARPRLFPGRHLGEDEFDRLQAYADARLAPLTATSRRGILYGLDCTPGVQPTRRRAGVLVQPGLAVAGDGQLVGLFVAAQATWAALLTDWLREQRQADASGVYYLTLRRGVGIVDAGTAVAPCQRAEEDPRRDLRREVLGTLSLRRLGLPAAAVAAWTPAQTQNQVAALHVDGTFLRDLGGAVPLALLAVSMRADAPALGELDPDLVDARFQVDWCSVAAGRYLAVPDSGQRVLLEQVQGAWREALTAALADPPVGAPDLPTALEQSFRLDFLPAAGALPLPLLEGADQPQPRLRWLPRHIAVDMVPVPEEAVAELLVRQLPRRVLDLRRPAGDRIRLLLAVNEPDWRADLLDFPAIDAALVEDLYRTHLRAYQAWRDWRIGYDALYAVREADNLSASELRALLLPALYPQPPRPGDFYSALIATARAELPLVGGNPPHPYDDGIPARPAFYASWLVAGEPPPVPAPADDGLVLQYRVRQLEMEGLDQRIRAMRARLEKHRDYLLLQRQQLDAQTVSLAALGGGVAGDGAGMQVARWLPFTKLRDALPVTPAPADGAVAIAASPAFASPAANLNLSQLTLAQPASLAVATRLDPSRLWAGDELIRPVATTTTPGREALKGGAASTVETNLQRDRLDKLAALPKEALTTPAVQGRAYQFGVLEQVQGEVREYEAAYRGMRDLISSLKGMFDAVEAAAIERVLEGFGVPISPNALAADQSERDYPLGGLDLERIRRRLGTLTGEENAAARTALTAVEAQYRAFLGARDLTESALELSAAPDPKRRFEALFQAGQILTRQIAWMEDRYQRLEDELEARLRERIRLEGELDRLADRIEAAARRLAGLDAKRLELLSDYGIAQALSREDWAAVYARDRARSRILTQELRGLYYVRELETPVALPVAEPLALRHGTARDLVPGCDWDTEVDVPAALGAVFAAVLEVAFADWRALAPLVPKLPVERLPDLFGLRGYRLGQRQSGLAGTGAVAGVYGAGLAARLAPVLATTGQFYQVVAARPAPVADARTRLLVEAGRQLALADALTLTGGLQREAQALHDRLEQCVVCLMDRLGRIAPSLRYQWGQLAEDDRLPADDPGRWPGLERAQAEDFNTVRTIAELIGWWFRQLADDASGEGRLALRNLIRAAVIVAAHGDPAQVLRGTVTTPPRLLALGESLRLTLNSVPAAGTRLQLLDDAQRVVGLLAVQDQDSGGVRAQVVRVDAVRQVTTRYTVVSAALSAGAPEALVAKVGAATARK